MPQPQDLEVLEKEKQRVGKPDSRPQVFQELVASFARSSGPVYHPIIIFIFLTLFLLPEHAALYLEILKALGIFGAGAAGGYGLRAYQDRRPDQPRDS